MFNLLYIKDWWFFWHENIDFKIDCRVEKEEKEQFVFPLFGIFLPLEDFVVIF